jgi:hypothetical protein
MQAQRLLLDEKSTSLIEDWKYEYGLEEYN